MLDTYIHNLLHVECETSEYLWIEKLGFENAGLYEALFLEVLGD